MRRYDEDRASIEDTLSDSTHRHIDEAMKSICALLHQLQAARRGVLAERLDAARQNLLNAKSVMSAHYLYRPKK